MSTWVDNQRQKAFKLWKTHLALGLHFSDVLGASYDFNKYNGNTKATFENFLKKSPSEIGAFSPLANRLESKGIDACEYIFANIVSDHSTYIKSLDSTKALDNYYGWKLQKGTREGFDEHVKRLLTESKIKIWFGDDTVTRFALDALVNKHNWDIVVHMISTVPELGENLNKATEDNAMMRIYLDIVSKNQRIYRHLGIV